jgi:hypothetical protein
LKSIDVSLYDPIESIINVNYFINSNKEYGDIVVLPKGAILFKKEIKRRYKSAVGGQFNFRSSFRKEILEQIMLLNLIRIDPDFVIDHVLSFYHERAVPLG